MNEQPPEPRRKRLGCFAILLRLLLVLIILILVWVAFNFRPAVSPGQPLVDVATELTAVTEPLNEDGDVDYLEALNQKYSAGVTTENNAMVKFAQALGPLGLPSEFIGPFCERLGIPALAAPAESSQYFVAFGSWRWQQSRKTSTDNAEEANYDDEMFGGLYDMSASPYEEPLTYRQVENKTFQLEYAQQYPWTADQFPSIAEWLDYNAAAIKTVEEGLGRSSYYHPLTATNFPKMMHVQLDFAENLREFRRYFAVRSMLRLGQGKVDESIDDVTSIFRLGEFIQFSPTLMEKLVSTSILKTAVECSAQIAIADDLNVTQLERLKRVVLAAVPESDLADRVDNAGRYSALATLYATGRGQDDLIAKSPQGWAMSHLVDSESVFRVANSKFDSYVRHLREMETGNPIERESAERSFGNEMTSMERGLMNPWEIAKTVLGGRRAKGNWAGHVMTSLLLPPVSHLVENEKRLDSSLELLKIFIAIERFQMANDRLPETLDALVPKYLDAIITDPFSKLPFQYEKIDGRIKLHSDAWISPENPEYEDLRRAEFRWNQQLLMSPKKITFKEFSEDDSE